MEDIIRYFPEELAIFFTGYLYACGFVLLLAFVAAVLARLLHRRVRPRQVALVLLFVALTAVMLLVLGLSVSAMIFGFFSAPRSGMIGLYLWVFSALCLACGTMAWLCETVIWRNVYARKKEENAHE